MNFPKDKYYILDGKKPVVTDDVIEWAKRFNEPRHVGNTFLFGKWGPHISTVFLGTNHQWREGPPLLFETMIFGGYHDEWMDRYATWEEAEKGHRRAVWLAIRTLPIHLLTKAYIYTRKFLVELFKT